MVASLLPSLVSTPTQETRLKDFTLVIQHVALTRSKQVDLYDNKQRKKNSYAVYKVNRTESLVAVEHENSQMLKMYVEMDEIAFAYRLKLNVKQQTTKRIVSCYYVPNYVF